MISITDLFIYTAILPPNNVTATVLTTRSIDVNWDQSSLPGVTGYLISYSTNASYTSGGSVTVDSNTMYYILTDLEENTFYTITVQTNINTAMSANSNEVSAITYTDG